MSPLPRLLRIGALTLTSALALAACEEQPLSSFDRAKFVADGPIAEHDLTFQAGSPSLARGQAAGLASFLQSLVLSPEDDIILHLGTTTSPVLDARRIATLRASLPKTPARVRLVPAPGFVDLVRVEVVRYNRVVVACPSNEAGPYELTTPLPDIGCANATNLAYQAAELRDLTDPRILHGSEGVTSVGAIERHREGKVITVPLDVNVGN